MGTGATPYSEVAGNAFYCEQGDFVAWDEQGLFPKLRQQYGDFAPALVLAHEWGHAVQARVGFADLPRPCTWSNRPTASPARGLPHVARATGASTAADLDSALAGHAGTA